MSFQFGASGHPQQPAQPQSTGVGPQQNPRAAILGLLGRQNNYAYTPMNEANADIARLGALRHDPQHDANMSYVAGQSGQGNPFSNGFFNQSAGNLDSVDPRIMKTQGNTAMNQLANPEQFGPASPRDESNPVNFADPFFQARMNNGWLGSAAPLGVQASRPNVPFTLPGQGQPGGFAQALNPHPFMPQQPPQMSPNVSLPPGAVMGDGMTNYFRKPQVQGSPRPGFGFSALQ